MEPNEFDEFVRSSLSQEDITHHDSAISQSKPYVWAAIQKQSSPILIVLKWYSAAAILLLLIVSSVLLYYFQNQEHRLEINRLQGQIDKISTNYADEIAGLKSQQEELKTIEAKFNRERKKKDSIQIREVVKVETQIVYRVDTVFQRMDIYQSELLPIETKQALDTTVLVNSKDSYSEIQVKDESIFPSFKTSNNSKNKENEIQFKFNSFAQ